MPPIPASWNSFNFGADRLPTAARRPPSSVVPRSPESASRTRQTRKMVESRCGLVADVQAAFGLGVHRP